MYSIDFESRTKKQIQKIHKNKKLYSRFKKILENIQSNPYSNSFKFERLKYYKLPTYSKRLSKKDRIVYVVIENKVKVIVVSVLGHYNDK